MPAPSSNSAAILEMEAAILVAVGAHARSTPTSVDDSTG